MIDYDLILNTLYTWLTGVTSQTVVVAEGRYSKRATPFITMKVITSSKLGIGETVSRPDTNGLVTIDVQRLATVSLQFFGKKGAVHPMNTAEQVRVDINKQATRELFHSAGMVCIRDFGINDITALVDTEFEPRANLDLELRLDGTYTDTIDVIETVQATQTITDEQGNVLKTFTIDITE